MLLIESKGRFIAYLDADDKWKNNKLEKQVNFMLDNKTLSKLIYPNSITSSDAKNNTLKSIEESLST